MRAVSWAYLALAYAFCTPILFRTAFLNQNLAIGNILDLERLIPECDALYRTILLLHRSRDMVVAKDGAA